MYQTPIIFNYMNLVLINSFEVFNILNTTSYVYFLRHYYLDLNIWYFFKNIYLQSQGYYVNNLSLSYSRWTINSSVHNLEPIISKFWPRINLKRRVNFLWGIRAVAFPLKRVTFNKLTFLILFILLRFFNSFSPNVNTTYSFLLLTTNVNFLTFYSSFYFKVHNF